MTMSIQEALAEGRLPNADAVLVSRSSRVDGEFGMRALDIRCWDGIDLRVLPDRGFDLGQAWFAGVPLAWVSAVGETGPLDRPEGMDWSTRFGGGLMVTCGLRNVGMPAEGITAGTRWEDVPDSWCCPDCSASKSDFQLVEL